VALRPRLSPGVPLSWGVTGQRDATVWYTSRQENLVLTPPRSVVANAICELVEGAALFWHNHDRGRPPFPTIRGQSIERGCRGPRHYGRADFIGFGGV
jgi:hypothetical protein